MSSNSRKFRESLKQKLATQSGPNLSGLDPSMMDPQTRQKAIQAQRNAYLKQWNPALFEDADDNGEDE
jgi:hypothetical protein